ncbi:MAG: transcription antitermination factor NusB [Phycisphaerales bacterium]
MPPPSRYPSRQNRDDRPRPDQRPRGGPRGGAPGGGRGGPSAAPRTPGDLARHAAYYRLAEQAEVFPVLSFEGPRTEQRPALDAAFAHAIYDAVLRRWFTLEYVVRGLLQGNYDELEPPLKAALLAGAAQLLLLDRVPQHAAVNETVSWAKWATNPGAGGLVNAVLRKIIEELLGGQPRRVEPTWGDRRDAIPLADGTALNIGRARLPEDPVERLAVATSHPRAILNRWATQYGAETAAKVALHDLLSPPTVLNIGATPPESVGCVPHRAPNHGVFMGTREELTAVLAANPTVWAQDPASSAAVESVAGMTPNLVIDVCAGQGTKTRQLARTFPRARIMASDTDQVRLERLKEAAAYEPRISVIDPVSMGRLQTGTADLVLLDVPCSNTGVLARRVEARYRFDAPQLERMATTQRTIFANAMRLLKPGGAILYATCSLEREENEAIVDAARESGQYEPERVRRALPTGLPGDGAAEYADGAFSAVLVQRQAEARGGRSSRKRT